MGKAKRKVNEIKDPCFKLLKRDGKALVFPMPNGRTKNASADYPPAIQIRSSSKPHSTVYRECFAAYDVLENNVLATSGIYPKCVNHSEAVSNECNQIPETRFSGNRKSGINSAIAAFLNVAFNSIPWSVHGASMKEGGTIA